MHILNGWIRSLIKALFRYVIYLILLFCEKMVLIRMGWAGWDGMRGGDDEVNSNYVSLRITIDNGCHSPCSLVPPNVQFKLLKSPDCLLVTIVTHL